MTTPFRDLPSVDHVLADRRIQRLIEEYSHEAVIGLVRTEIEAARGALKNGHQAPAVDQVVLSVEERAAARWRPWPRPVINATGVILHTNLGRAPLSRDALKAIEQASAGYSDLEFDTESGKRGSRQSYVARLICQLTGAEAATVVNNNASAVLLGLAAVAAGRDVIVSRGEAVEIGGGFRIPDVLRQSGATLVEVGTTNRTYARDYETAISENTAAILSVHTSNFRVTGFTHSPSMAELVSLGNGKIPVLHDLGSGCLLDTSTFGLAHEPMPQESLAAGVSLAFFSGDKLLGGPQAGIIVGDGELVATVQNNPLARAVRIDKLSLAALIATLVHYIRDEALEKIPVWRMVAESVESLESRANGWTKSLGDKVSVVAGHSTIGGGSLPGETLPTSLLSLNSSAVAGGAKALAARLRNGNPPVIARIEDERVVIDPRTVLPEQDDPLLTVVEQALTTKH